MGLIALLVVLAVPALAAKPLPALVEASKLENAQPPAPPGLANKPEKAPKAPITVSGTVQETSGGHGWPVFTLQDSATTYMLEAGPPWFYGQDHPLKKYVGMSVTVVGEVAEGSTEIEVDTVDGTALREPGRPPWAGGWKVVGESHPGWSQDKADRFNGGCWPPGHCKGNSQTDE
jgi:hypothetical protein